MNIVEQNISNGFELCRLHQVKNMYLYGSILTKNFSPDSDVDFLVNFDNVDLFQYFNNYTHTNVALGTYRYKQC